MGTFIFLWLQNQHFYKTLQQKALDAIPTTSSQERWADIGCSTGLITRLAEKKGYQVTGYDPSTFSLLVAKLLSFGKAQIDHKKENLFNINETFIIISATSLLSVVEDEKKALAKLISLLKTKESTLVIIEPTEEMSIQNVQTHISNLKSWWYYKGLLLWAKAREGKAVDVEVFNDLEDLEITHHYHLHDMVRVSYLKKDVMKKLNVPSNLPLSHPY